jgi:hypothetical protein
MLIITTIKPQMETLEYGISEAGQWVIHGLTVNVAMTSETTIGELQTAAEADAIERGLIEA